MSHHSTSIQYMRRLLSVIYGRTDSTRTAFLVGLSRISSLSPKLTRADYDLYVVARGKRLRATSRRALGDAAASLAGADPTRQR